MRVLIISGQSSTLQNATALATACHAAASGLRVLVVGMGPTGLLGELLGQSLGSRPQELSANLAAMELDALDEFYQRWDMLRNDPKYGISGRLKEIQPDELPSFPSMDEMASLIVCDRAVQTDKFDLLVFGGSSIESLLRGVTMREMVRWLIRLISGLKRGPGMSKGSEEAAMMPASLLNAMPSAGLMQELRTALEHFGVWFQDQANSRVRLVYQADEMSLPMMRFAMSGLGLYGMHVDTIFSRGEQENINAEVRQKFDSLITPSTIELTPTDMDGWTERGKQMYAQRSEGLGLPNDVMTKPPKFVEQKEIQLHIPMMDAKTLDIGVASEEIVVRIGPFRRHLLMAGMEKGGRLRAKVEGETLRLWVETDS